MGSQVSSASVHVMQLQKAENRLEFCDSPL